MICLLAFGAPAAAQEPYNLLAPVHSLATLFTDLYGARGLIVDSEATLPNEQPHTAHFNSSFQADFGQFSTALVSQLVSLPLPSPASGFTYQFDRGLGVFQRTTQSFGPILAERAETIGAGRVSVGFAFQRFTFDTIEGLGLERVPAVFTHDNAFLLGGRQDVVTTLNSIRATVDQTTTFLTLGVSDRFDVSVAVPVVTNDLRIVSDATIRRLGTTNVLTHFFRQADGEVGDERLFTAAGRATGLGDVTIRLKGTVLNAPRRGLALGVDLRLPTGDEMNLLGTGTTSVQPYAAWSTSVQRTSPHLNVSYKWIGSSVLAGNPATGTLADFPDQATYALGADVNVNPRLTVAFDVLGQYVIDASRLVQQDFNALDGVSVFPNVVFERDSFNALSGAFGLKANPVGRLLLDVNVLFKLDDHGLRDKITPLIGIEYRLLMRLTDAHCHFLSPRFFEALGREKFGQPGDHCADRAASALGWDPPGPADALAAQWRAEFDRHHVSCAALMASVPGDEESVAAAVARYPDCFVGFFVLNPTVDGAADRAERAFTTLGLRCVCLFPAMHHYALDDPRVVRIFEVAAAHGGAIFAHCGFFSIEARSKLGLRTNLDLRLGNPLTLAATATTFPGVPVIVPHFGSGFFREALMAGEACSNIHLDTSSSNNWLRYFPGLTLADVFRRALAVLGPDRILFGSDSSFFPRGWRKVIYGAQRTALDEIGVENDTVEKIFGANFDRLFPAPAA